MRVHVIHIGEADTDGGIMTQRAWIVPEEVAAQIAQSLGEPFSEYLATPEQVTAIGRSFTDAGVATIDNLKG